MPLKAHVLKVWPPVHGAIGRKWNLSEERLKGAHLKGDIGTLPPSFHSLFIPHHELSDFSLPCVPHQNVLACQRPTAKGPIIDHGLKSLSP
jgi:hypothetical protein